MVSDLNIPSPAFDEWLIGEREHLQQRAVDLLRSLASYYERRNNPERVKYLAQRQIELEPWSEEAYWRLMRAYAQLGRPEIIMLRCEILLRACTASPPAL
jgi:DNA-binding SARP family transcriptional activator